MRTRKGGFDPLSLVRVSKKAYDANQTDCVDFFNNHPLYLPPNKKKWNSFIDANPNLRLGELKLEGENADEITDDYDNQDIPENKRKHLCGRPYIVENIRFPGSFRKGFGINNTLSLANGSVKGKSEGGTRRKRRKRHSK